MKPTSHDTMLLRKIIEHDTIVTTTWASQGKNKTLSQGLDTSLPHTCAPSNFIITSQTASMSNLINIDKQNKKTRYTNFPLDFEFLLLQETNVAGNRNNDKNLPWCYRQALPVCFLFFFLLPRLTQDF